LPVPGLTGSVLGESDGFLRKYLPNGTEVWTRRSGMPDYYAVYGMASDPKGVVVVATCTMLRRPGERRRPRCPPREDRVLLTRLFRKGLARKAIWWKLAA
jgi:hypothetical protein